MKIYFKILNIVLMSILIFLFQNCQPFSNVTDNSSLSFMATSVLEQHCVACHSIPGQGGVEGILNTQKMIDDGFLVPGDPDHSDIYISVDNNSMPETYNLTDSEKSILRSWIESLPPIIPGPIPAPTCILSVDSTAITSGQSINLTLVPSGTVSSASINGQSISNSGGSIQVTPTQTGTYSGSVSNATGSYTCNSPQVTVNPPVVNGPTCMITANKTTVVQGQSVTITLVPSGTVTSATLNGQSISNAGASIQVTPTQSGTYAGSVTNSAGTYNCTSPQITVNPPTPSCSLASDKTSVTSGQSVTLTLTPSGTVTSAKINNQSIAVTGGSIQVTPTQSGTYSGSVSNVTGTATCTTPQITVNPVVNAPTCSLAASPTTVTSGQSVTLTLTPSGTVTSAKINNQAIATSGGSIQVTPTQSGTYSGSVTNASGTNTCTSPQITVNVANPKPTCTLAVTKPSGLIPGEKVDFTLNITGSATSAKIDNNTVSVSSPSLYGVAVFANKTFSATVTNASGSNTCSVAVATKPQAQWTKYEYFIAQIGPVFQGGSVPQSIYDYSVNRCYTCHSIPGNGLASTYMVVSLFDSMATYNAIRSIYLPGPMRYIDLAAPPVNTESFWSFAKNHKPKNPPFTSAELTHITNFINF